MRATSAPDVDEQSLELLLRSAHVVRSNSRLMRNREFTHLHGSVKQVHHEGFEDGDKERPSASPKIMLKQTNSGIQQLRGAGERTQGSATQASPACR
jgi:hypothetical protein